jgi:polyisoprenoid-binding protein YceI
MRPLILALVLFLPTASAESYEIHPAVSDRLELTVEKTGLYRGKKHLFLFEKYDGRLQFDPLKPEASQVQLTIESRSLVCKDNWVSAGDLKKVQQTALDEMLAVKQHPSMMFTSGAIKPLGGERYEVQGTLTIRSLSKPILLTVHLNATDPNALRLSGGATIRLSDYNLKPPSALLGAIGTKNEMTLAFSVVATRLGAP